VLEMLQAHATVLEICPTSNVQSGVVADFGAHPLRALYQGGIETTINTDDPLICNVTMSDEIAQVLRTMPLSLDDVKANILTAARASFLPPSQREALVAQYQTWLYP